MVRVSVNLRVTVRVPVRGKGLRVRSELGFMKTGRQIPNIKIVNGNATCHIPNITIANGIATSQGCRNSVRT